MTNAGAAAQALRDWSMVQRHDIHEFVPIVAAQIALAQRYPSQSALRCIVTHSLKHIEDMRPPWR